MTRVFGLWPLVHGDQVYPPLVLVACEILAANLARSEEDKYIIVFRHGGVSTFFYTSECEPSSCGRSNMAPRRDGFMGYTAPTNCRIQLPDLGTAASMGVNDYYSLKSRVAGSPMFIQPALGGQPTENIVDIDC